VSHCIRILLTILAVLHATAAFAQPGPREPRIGYVYPGGGRQGTTFEVLVGGQGLQGASELHVSADGVTGTVLHHYRPIRNISAEQRQAIQQRLRELMDQRLTEMPRPMRAFAGRRAADATRRGANGLGRARRRAATQPAVELPDHPLLRNLEQKSLPELRHVINELFDLKKRPPNPQIAESLLVKISIDAKAEPGEREIRLQTPLGLSNPMRFHVGTALETQEREPNDPGVEQPPSDGPAVEVPVVFNGQIQPGDVDRLRFRAKKGQRLVLETWARRLIPFLADAVPGWFQATMTLYAQGVEVAFADDYRFDPDPVLFYQVPEDGVYELEIRDSIYRGRDDFVYRVAVGTQPFVTELFPLGCPAGAKRVAAIEGWNLADKRLLLDGSSENEGIQQTRSRQRERLSNPLRYAADPLPESNEAEPNDTADQAQLIEPPRIVNGRISRPGDVDWLAFVGRAGDEIVADIHARRLYSPLDSLLRLTDASGRVITWNDDTPDAASGLLTHHADSYLRARLPEDGTYHVQVADAQGHGGGSYAYRLRIGPPRPDFALYLMPSSINIRAGGTALIRVQAVRRDGFNGQIEVVLKEPEDGFTLSGGRIPPGRDAVQMTLTAHGRPAGEPVRLHLEGRAEIGGESISRPVVPAEDMEQAFAYRHLAPSQELMIAVLGGRRPGAPLERRNAGIVEIPAGGSSAVRFNTPRAFMPRDIRLELAGPPEGVTLEKVDVTRGELVLILKCDKSVSAGLADNLIVQAFAEGADRQRSGKGQTGQRNLLGVLPAIPIQIVDHR
jgi:hypothetical protein